MTGNRKHVLILFLSLALIAGSVTVSTVTAQETPIVLDIVVTGNDQVDTATILDAMTEIKIGDPLDVDAANQDLFNIYKLGYFYDVVAGTEPIAGTRDGTRLVIEVFEFPVLSGVSIESDGVPADVVRGWMTTRGGRILNQVELEQDVAVIQDKAVQEYGVYVRPAVLDLDEQQNVLVLELRAARVADVTFVGNEKTKDHVISREITVQAGDVLNRQQVQRTMQRLSLLGYFDDVSAQFTETDDPDTLGIVFELQERKTGLASFGAGYSSADGFIGYVEVADENFLGRGQRANLRWEFGRTRNTYDLGFYEPYFLGSQTSLGFNLYNTRTERQREGVAHATRENGGDVSIGRPLGEFTRGFVTYKLSNWSRLEDGALVTEGNTRSVTLSTNTDTRNHPFSPTEGFRSRVAVERAGGFLGGTDNFTKYEGSYSTYFKVGSRDKQAFAVRGIVGLGQGVNGGLDQMHQFRVGGADTLRGYDYDDEGLRGDRMLVLNTEFRFPIANAVEGAVFADFGNAFAHDEPIELSKLKMGYGVGVRLDTPLGIMRIDYGIGENGGRTYFSLGPAF